MINIKKQITKQVVNSMHPFYPHREIFVIDSEAVKLNLYLYTKSAIYAFTSKVPFVGIYFLFFRKELMYVGQSINITARLRQHEKNIAFDNYGMLIIKDVDAKSLDKIENYFINQCKPFLNKKNANYNV